MLPKISDENLICLTRIGLWLTEDPEVVDVIEKVKGLLETPGHPAKELFRRVLDSLPERRRIRIFETLFNGGRSDTGTGLAFAGGKRTSTEGGSLQFP